MSSGMKRSRGNELKEEATSNKKQTTLLSMFKPAPKPASAAVTISSTTLTAVESLDVAAEDTKKDPRDLFKNCDKETLELLDLEIRTMNYEWLKVLAPELTKPYFLNVKKKNVIRVNFELICQNIVEEIFKSRVRCQKDYFPPL
jgi:hypothetical protein